VVTGRARMTGYTFAVQAPASARLWKYYHDGYWNWDGNQQPGYFVFEDAVVESTGTGTIALEGTSTRGAEGISFQDSSINRQRQVAVVALL
jgi:hypothetical protein